MDTNELRTYHLLEAIDTTPPPSQRELAKKLDISLGLVNAFIKRLARKGYFKVTTIPKNRVKYILTPKGAAEKARLTYEYIHYSFRYYRDMRKRLKALFSEFEGGNENRIVFYGISELAEIAFVTLQEAALELVAVVDEKKNGKKFFQHTVLSPEALGQFEFDVVLITGVESTVQHKISQNLASNSTHRIVTVIP
ncbi:MAG: winged helix-turn-helix transcriptional regulator [Desulfosarcinaceae bacterium]|nr:winged helix-turn-helix transcriptional regulator [Desulfosarcinaceae bacterium]